MASGLEGTYKSLLQGVSQQVPRLRLEGQVTKQNNMLSDPVTAMRRRPGTPLTAVYNFGVVTDNNLYTQYLERGSDGRNLIINTTSGAWWLLDKEGMEIKASGQDNYFIASGGASSIQTTSVGGETFLLNIQQAPVAVTSSTKVNPDTTGWYFTKVGAFSKDYTLTVKTGGTTKTVVYSTPAGTDATQVSQATPVYITSRLSTLLTAQGITNVVDGPYMRITGTATVTVNSNSGVSYVGYSGTHNVPLITDLPALLPSGSNGIMTSVGTNANALTWYRWDESAQSWKEDGSFESPTAIQNMPRVLSVDTLSAPDFEGRYAGDELTNEIPTFLEQAVITGMTTYQGRLVLLSGAFVTMSKAGNPYRFYRSTVTELQPGDRIDIGIGSSQNSVLRRGIQFNRDLVLFGDSVQAVVTGGGNIVSPQTAAISLTSEESCVSKISPMQAGQTVLYPFKRSGQFSGFLELIPSQYTSSQYISQDATGHIPQYMQGDIRFTTASNVVNMCVTAGTGNPRELYVHEYQWSSEGKQQAAWHKWIMPYNVAAAHFAREQLIVLLRDNGNVYLTAIDPREGYDNQTDTALPYLDLFSPVEVVGGEFTVPMHLRSLVSTDAFTLGMAFATGTAATEAAGIYGFNQTTWVGMVELGVPDGTYWLGVKYLSEFTPTPPILKDDSGKEVGSGHVRLVRLEVAVRNTGKFLARVADSRTDVDHTADYTGVFMNSPELVPDYPLVISQANILIPCRTLADTTEVTFSSSGTHDMNLIDISYLLRYNQRRRRV